MSSPSEMKYFTAILEAAPWQVYDAAALDFRSEESLDRTCHLECLQTWLIRTYTIEDECGPASQTLEVPGLNGDKAHVSSDQSSVLFTRHPLRQSCTWSAQSNTASALISRCGLAQICVKLLSSQNVHSHFLSHEYKSRSRRIIRHIFVSGFLLFIWTLTQNVLHICLSKLFVWTLPRSEVVLGIHSMLSTYIINPSLTDDVVIVSWILPPQLLPLPPPPVLLSSPKLLPHHVVSQGLPSLMAPLYLLYDIYCTFIPGARVRGSNDPLQHGNNPYAFFQLGLYPFLLAGLRFSCSWWGERLKMFGEEFSTSGDIWWKEWTRASFKFGIPGSIQKYIWLYYSVINHQTTHPAVQIPALTPSIPLVSLHTALSCIQKH